MAVAELGYVIDSSGAVVAAKNLDAMTASAIKAETGANRLSSVAGKLDAQFNTAQKGFKDAAASADVFGKEMDALRAKYNPLFAASMQYEAALNDIAQAERLGAISANEAAAARAAAASGLRVSATAANGYSAAMVGAGGATANVFAQMNDIAVMMAAGQNPIQLAMQQGMQLNQVWGQLGGNMKSIGSVIGGAFMSMLNPINLATIGIIAGGAALANWAMSAGDAESGSEKLSDGFSELAASANSYATALQQASMNSVELVAKYGTQAAELQRIYDLNVALQRINLQQSINELSSQVGANYSSLGDDLERIIALSKAAAETTMSQSTAHDMLKSAVGRLRDEYGLAFGQAVDLNRAIQNLANASTMDEQARAATEFGEALVDAQKSGATIPPEMIRIAIEAGASASAIRDLEASLHDAAAAASTITIPGSGGGGERGDPRQFTSVDEFRQQLADQAAWTPPKRPGGGRRSGGGSAAADTYSQDLDALITSMQTERETIDAWYAESQAVLNDQRAQELLGVQGHNDAKLRLEQEYQERLAGIRGGYNGAALDQAGQFFGDMAAALAGGNEKMVKISQAFASIEALINAYRAYNQVLADPTLPWFAKIPAALGVLSAGMKTVSSIKSLSGSGGGGSSAGSASAPSATSTATAPQTRAIIQVQGGRSRFTVDEINDIIAGVQDQVSDGVIIEGFTYA